MTLRPYLPWRGVLGGALAGFGTLVLLQQFAVVVPTRSAFLAGVLGGALLALLASNVVRAVAGRSPDAQPATPAAAASGHVATHRTPAAGADAYEAPGATTPVAHLDPGLDVVLLERSGDWGHVRCTNGWETWVDARALVAI